MEERLGGRWIRIQKTRGGNCWWEKRRRAGRHALSQRLVGWRVWWDNHTGSGEEADQVGIQAESLYLVGTRRESRNNHTSCENFLVSACLSRSPFKQEVDEEPTRSTYDCCLPSPREKGGENTHQTPAHSHRILILCGFCNKNTSLILENYCFTLFLQAVSHLINHRSWSTLLNWGQASVFIIENEYIKLLSKATQTNAVAMCNRHQTVITFQTPTSSHPQVTGSNPFPSKLPWQVRTKSTSNIVNLYHSITSILTSPHSKFSPWFPSLASSWDDP